MDYEEAFELGFEIYAECSTYQRALNEVVSLMKENCSNCAYIWNRMSGETPYKVMIIPNSSLTD